MIKIRSSDLPSNEQGPSLKPLDGHSLLIRDAGDFDLNVIRVLCLADVSVRNPRYDCRCCGGRWDPGWRWRAVANVVPFCA